MIRENLTWIQNGESITEELLNRLPLELFGNDVFLNSYKVDNSEEFLAAEIIPISKICKLTSLGMIIASCFSEIRSSGLLAYSMENIEYGFTGRFLLMGKVDTIAELGIPIYLGLDGTITTEPPIISRILGYSLGTSFFFNPKD